MTVRADHELRSKVEQHLRTLQARADEIARHYRDAIIAVADQLSIRRQLSGEEIRRIVVATSPKDQPEPTNR